ncbi:MAG: hypothetical protein ABI480_16270, partial [Chitinophagaceae bacterium]
MKPLLPNRFFLKLSLLLAAIVLFALSFIFNKIYSNRTAVNDEVSQAERYLAHEQEDFNSFLADTMLVSRLVASRESRDEFNKTVKKAYGLFLYGVSNDGILSMRFWSNQFILPPPETYSSGDLEEYMHLLNGYYLVIKKNVRLSNITVVAYAMIPIRSEFFLETDYLPQKFVYSSTADNQVVIAKDSTAFPVKSLSGKTLFYFDQKISSVIPYNNRLTILLRFSGLLLLLLFTHLVADSLARQKIWKGVLFLGVILLVLRLIIYEFPELLNLRQFELFDPSVYG